MSLIYQYKLGKLAAVHDHRVPKFARYLIDEASPPVSVDWTKGRADWGMMKNDELGCCTAAGVGHAYQLWTQSSRGVLWSPSDANIVNFYSLSAGYKLNKPDTDNGGVETDVLAYLLHHGFQGFTLDAFTSVNISNLENVKRCVQLLGLAYIGISLPVTAQKQKIWDVVGNGSTGDAAPNSWGGHCVIAVAYDEKYVTVITWGKLQKMTWEFWNTYVDEAYGLLAGAFMKPDGTAPNGFRRDVLRADMPRLL